MKVTVTRESDGSQMTFDEFSEYRVLSSTKIPEPTTAQVASYAYPTDDGGFATVGRYESRPFELDFEVFERYGGKNIIRLMQDVRTFLALHDNKGNLNFFDVVFQWQSLNGMNSFMLRSGWINDPASFPLHDSSSYHAQGTVGFIFGDPFLYNARGADSYTSIGLTPYEQQTSGGEVWTTQGQQWSNGTGSSTWTVSSSTGSPVSFSFETEQSTPFDSVTITGQISQPILTMINSMGTSTLIFTDNIPVGATLTVSSSGTALLTDSLGNTTTVSSKVIGSINAVDGYNQLTLTTLGTFSASASASVTYLAAF